MNSRTTRRKTEDTYIALLRGINVGGKNILPMEALAALFTQAGCDRVQTYIQSGNVLFTAAPQLTKRLSDLIAKRIADRFGIRVPVLLRTARELDQVARGNPFLKLGTPIDALHVAFLSDRPSPSAVANLDSNRSRPDAFVVRGREVYQQLPNRAGRTKLTNQYFDSTLATTSTVRNWKTVLKLRELASAVG
jgi:uncharacterized protein (DUF1697 family)